MRKISIVLFAFVTVGVTSCTVHQKKQNMGNYKVLETVIDKFVVAGENRDIAAYDDILHENFRVIANRYPTVGKISILSADVYKSLLSKKVIGGTKYNVTYKNFDVTSHSATVSVELKAEKGGQLITFLLVKNEKDKWLIISDMATQTK